VSNPDGPLGQEPVGSLLRLSERLVGAWGDREALGQSVHHLGAGEGGRLSGQPVRTGQRVQRRVQLSPGGWTALSTRADLDQLALAHPLLSKLGSPPLVDARLGLAVVLGRPGRHRRRAGRLDAGQAMGVQPLVDLF
jgi:hypothetical protein